MNTFHGLTNEKAKELLCLYGYNELPSAKKRSLFSLLLLSISEPMILLLLACACLYLLIGEPKDSALLFASIIGIILITFYQEYRSNRALEALRDLSSPRARVLRDGKDIRISGREVVPGDLLILSEGDRVAADATLLKSALLQVDESLLTGESEPADKSESLKNQIFASTLVTRGTGIAKVTATAMNTEVGKIGSSLISNSTDYSRLQIEINELVRIFAIIGIGFSFLVTLTYGFTRGDWPQGLLAGLAAAMSLLPEEFPVIMTIFLAIGAWRLSKQNVLVRQVTASENLGDISVLCVDKTGTLTMNEMTVEQCRTPDAFFSFASNTNEALPEEFHKLIEYSVLASQKDPFDPMEKAVHRTLKMKLSSTEHIHHDWTVVREYPLSPKLLAMSFAWQSPSENAFKIAAKGAPEAMINLCHLNKIQKEKIFQQVKSMAKEGLRVIAVAKCEHLSSQLHENQQDYDFEFLGLIGLKDPVRPEVPAAISECYKAGIRIIMITGDYPETASRIASNIGLHFSENFLTGEQLEAMNDLELRQKIKSVNVFARMVPNQKLRIVNALKANNEIVAMTGDGVNDAPSLKWADVGIAMGKRGTDVAREAADLVLLDDCFTSIVMAIGSGRKIFENIKSAMAYVFAVHIPIAGMAILPVLCGFPSALFPAHIVFLELVIDPACTLIFESEPKDEKIMQRPPRKIGRRLFSLKEILRSCLQGGFVFLGVFGIYSINIKNQVPTDIARTTSFCAFVFSNIGLLITNRPHLMRLQNNSFIWITIITILLLATVIYVPFLQSLFGFAEIPFINWSIALLISTTTVLIGSFFSIKP